MVAKDDLFQLVKALSNSEKRYFKLFASRHSAADDNNVTELFDEIDRLDEYDEEKLKKKLSKKKQNSSLVKYLSAEKNALHTLIMRAMRAFHGEKTVDVQLHELMTDELFYHGKSLYDLQSRTIYKAKKLAEQYEKFPVMLMLLQREAKMLIERKTKDYDEVRSRVHKEGEATIAKLVNEFEFKMLNDDVFIDTRIGANVRDPEFLKQLDTKLAKTIMEDEKNALSFHARRSYHSILRASSRLKSDYKKSWEHAGKIVELYEAHPQIKEEYSLEYKIALSNYLGACHVTQKYAEFELVLKKLKSLPIKSMDEEGEVFQDVSLYQILYYLNTGKFTEAVEAIPEIEKGLKLYAAKINKSVELTLYYNISLLFFILEDWKQALRWVNKIINDKSDSRKDLQFFARILELILQYELGKGELLEYTTRSVYRYLEKEGRLHGFERLMLTYLKKLPFALDKKALLQSFAKLREEIEKLKNMPDEKAKYGMDELSLWLTSKIENRKLEDVVREAD